MIHEYEAIFVGTCKETGATERRKVYGQGESFTDASLSMSKDVDKISESLEVLDVLSVIRLPLTHSAGGSLGPWDEDIAS